jgi:RNA polymerase sigma factor (sigma-70 family)
MEPVNEERMSPQFPSPDLHAQSAAPDTFRVIVDQHARWLFAAAYRQLHDPHLAEEATQTVFILLYRRPHLMSSPKLSGWLFNTLQFTLHNMRRESRRRRARERRMAEHPPVTSIASPHATDLHDQLDAAVAQLSTVDRSAILLRFYQDLPFEQIAATLCISEPAARKRVTRAVHTLRKRLGVAGDSATLSSLSLAAAHGLSHAPAHLALTITTLSTTSALPAGIVATLKGASTFMALAKFQTAAILTLAALVVAVPAAFLIFKNTGAPPLPTAPSPAASETPSLASTPAPPQEVEAPYALQPGQILRRIANLPPELRDPVVHRYFGPGATDHVAFNLLWLNNKPIGTGSLPTPPYPLLYVANQIFNTQYSSVEGDLLTHEITGDFSYDFDRKIPSDRFLVPFQQILRDELHLPATVQFRDVPRKVIVLRGHWNYTPSPDFPPSRKRNLNDPKHPVVPCVSFYGDLQSDVTYGSPSVVGGGAHTFATTISYFLHQDVQIEADGIPEAMATRDPLIDNYADAAVLLPDKIKILDHLTQQTALTWSEETRTVRHLFIEATPPK